MDANQALKIEIEKREERIAELKREVGSLREALRIVTGTAEANTGAVAAVISGTASQPSPREDPLGVSAAVAVMGDVLAVSASAKWHAEAERILADREPHELKELVERVQRSNPGVVATDERVRKHLHMWITRRVERGEVIRLGRGWYQLATKS